MTTVKAQIRQVLRRDEGALLLEYVLLVALIAAVCVAVIGVFGMAVQGKFQASFNSLPF